MPSSSPPSRRKDLQQVLEYSAVRALALLMRILGTDRASAMMGWVWQTVGPRTRRQERVIRNLQNAFPDYSATEIASIARLQWNNLGRTFAESFLIDRFIGEPGRFSVSDSALIDRIAETGKGFVVVGLHSGNWELACAPFAQSYMLTGMYQKLSNSRVDGYVRRLREQVFRGGLLAKSRATPKYAMQVVRDGGVIAMLADQRERKGVDVQFFDQASLANPFPSMIARRLNVPLIAGRAVRLDGATFRVDALEIKVPHTDDVSEDVKAATQTVQRQFEDWIREYPGQWMWVQDRWRLGVRRRRSAGLDKSGANAN